MFILRPSTNGNQQYCKNSRGFRHRSLRFEVQMKTKSRELDNEFARQGVPLKVCPEPAEGPGFGLSGAYMYPIQ
jgi:hypothetical protein